MRSARDATVLLKRRAVFISRKRRPAENRRRDAELGRF